MLPGGPESAYPGTAVTRLPAGGPLARALGELLPGAALGTGGEIILEPLPSGSRPVYRFTSGQRGPLAVGKLLWTYPPQTAADQGLLREYANYLGAPAWGLNHDSGLIPRLLGRRSQAGLGLLLENLGGPDLDHFLLRACMQGETEALHRALENLAELLAFFHTRPVPPIPVSPQAALEYLDKLGRQLQGLGLLSPEDKGALEEEKIAWESRFHDFGDRQVLIHGDATPTNFLFPDGGAVALDLERLRLDDRLWDLSWVAGELKHAWGWRTHDLAGGERAIRHFFGAYLAALPPDAALAHRLYCLNPFYLALAELRIARNAYLSWDYRRALVAEARACLAWGRRL
jgi:aminoglycoside phosphotransferase